MQHRIIQVSEAPTARHSLNEISGLEDPSCKIPDSFDGAVFLADARMNIKARNHKAAPLTDYFLNPPPDLREFIVSSLAHSRIDHRKIKIPGPEGEKSFELYVIPAARHKGGQNKLWLLLRDISLEQNLISALMESRQLFKDLVTCSSDFSWETNIRGEFEYVSAKGALEYAAHELVGRRARDFLCAPDMPAIAFEAKSPVNDQELWIYSFNGAKSCLSISAIPKIGRDGLWQGARGVCRDITTLKKQQSDLEKARISERLRIDILSAMRDLKAGDQLLTQTALAITQALPGVICQIARQKGSGPLFTPAVGDEAQSLDLDILAETSFAFLPDSLLARQPGSHTPHSLMLDKRPALFMMTEYRHKINGAIFLIAPSKGNLPDNAPEILLEASSHVGIAIDHIETHENLERLSRTDELTGLLNRRAFLADAEVELYTHKGKNNQGCALLYLDIDNLKAVNDQTGHASGDFVIASFGKKLASLSGGKYLAARIGGDEFLLLMSGAGRPEAEDLANQLVEFCKSLNGPVGFTSPALGLSVGISIIHPHRKTEIGAVICRADEALYMAKRNGKGSFIVIEN